jgi:hypothetical protein
MTIQVRPRDWTGSQLRWTTFFAASPESGEQALTYALALVRGANRPAPHSLVEMRRHADSALVRVGELESDTRDWCGLLARAGRRGTTVEMTLGRPPCAGDQARRWYATAIWSRMTQNHVFVSWRVMAVSGGAAGSVAVALAGFGDSAANREESHLIGERVLFEVAAGETVSQIRSTTLDLEAGLSATCTLAYAVNGPPLVPISPAAPGTQA